MNKDTDKTKAQLLAELEKIKKEEMKRLGELFVAEKSVFLWMPLRTRTRSSYYRQRSLTTMKMEGGNDVY